MRHIDLPEDLARFADAEVAAGRFPNIEAVVRAGVEVLRHSGGPLRAAWDEGLASFDRHGAQLGTEAEFTAFLDECVVAAPRP